MSKPTDITPVGVTLYFMPVPMRVPLKFGTEVCTDVTCARVAMVVADARGRRATGWGETPLGVQWCWPSKLPFGPREALMQRLCEMIADAWMHDVAAGHPIELGYDFIEHRLPGLLAAINAENELAEPVSLLTGLVCCAAFDIALHDAFGQLLGKPMYQLYGPSFMSRDLSQFLAPAADAGVDFSGRFPGEFVTSEPPRSIPVWHLVGGVDPLGDDECTGSEPDDGYPVTLPAWLERDGLNCLKIKLRGNDAAWDYQRLVDVGRIAIEHGVDWLTTDFNCTVSEAQYVNDILDKLVLEQPRIYGMILYVEQPFPYDLENNRIDVHSVSARKPLFMDESAHDWQHVRMGRALGWTGVALKTCKTQTGALLSACWAKAHGMTLMVQDSTNPMLAIIPHALLAAHVGTIMGAECNSAQYYPAASAPEQKVHPGLYCRRDGRIDLSTVRGPGFGYQVDRIERQLPDPARKCEA